MLKVSVSDGQRRGSLFAPIHWSDANASSARVGELVNPATDPFSGQPEAKATPAAITRVDYRFAGFLLSKQPMTLPQHTWWAKSAAAGGEGFLLASNDGPERWRSFVHAQVGDGISLSEYLDEPRGTYRAAGFADGRLAFCLFVGPASQRPRWDVAKALLAAETLEDRQRRILLSGQSADGMADAGPRRLRLFRRRAEYHPRSARLGRGHRRRRHRQGAARRNKLRLLPARTEEDRGPDRSGSRGTP